MGCPWVVTVMAVVLVSVTFADPTEFIRVDPSSRQFIDSVGKATSSVLWYEVIGFCRPSSSVSWNECRE